MAEDILGFVNRDGSAGVSSEEILELEKLRGAPMGRWNNLIQCALDNDNTKVFHEISEIVWTTEKATDKALFDSEDFLQSLLFKDNGQGSSSGVDAEYKVPGLDIYRSNYGENTNEVVGENVDDDAKEDILEGDVCYGNTGCGVFKRGIQN